MRAQLLWLGRRPEWGGRGARRPEARAVGHDHRSDERTQAPRCVPARRCRRTRRRGRLRRRRRRRPVAVGRAGGLIGGSREGRSRRGGPGGDQRPRGVGGSGGGLHEGRPVATCGAELAVRGGLVRTCELCPGTQRCLENSRSEGQKLRRFRHLSPPYLTATPAGAASSQAPRRRLPRRTLSACSASPTA